MCGFLFTTGIDRSFNHRQLNSLRRRGPDAVGFWASPRAQFGFTRLAIIGLDENSNQPQENDRFVLAFNGEIYNFQEIRERLRAAGTVFSSSSDTEVLLHAWTLWGKDILRQLTGFWAFALYDKAHHRLTLVRDQLGIKPLYYWHTPQMTCAASTLRTVLEVTGEAPELNYSALSEYVRYQFTFGDHTFVRQVRKVLPGHCVEIQLDSGKLTDTVYEDILSPEPSSSDIKDLVEETNRLIVECCQESTISDTSFTTFCSGGLDSSLITSITRPDIAYHCNYSDPDCNETFYARQVVAPLSTRLMVVNAQEKFDLVARLNSIVEDFDELTVGSVILPLDDLLAQVKRRHKVILTGTGGDELFGGYVRYQLALGDCYQDSYRALFERMRRLDSVPARFELAHQKGNTSLYAFYEDQARQTFYEHFDACRTGGDDLHAMLTFDRRYFLAGLLNIEDKLCGRHSLEGRPSFLHQKLVRHVLRIPPAALLQQKQLKYFLRQAAAQHLPDSVLRRTDKMGFTTPVGTFVNQSAHLIREQINSSKFRSLYQLHNVHFTAEGKFSREIFGLLILDLWLNRYAVQPAAAAAAD